MSTEEILSGLPSWATLPNTSGTVAGTFPQWDGTKWVAVTNGGGGGSGDVTQAGNNNFTGSNNFATAPRVAGFDVATVNDLSNVLKLSAPITDGTTFVNITDYANNATGLSLTSAYFKSDVNYNGSSGFIVKNSANTGNAIAQLLLQNNAGNVGQIFAGSETSVYGANAFVMVQYKDAPMRFVSNTSNAFVFASNIAGTNQYASISNTSIDLNKPTNINSSLALVNIAEPVGTAGKTTLYSDTSGRLAWRNGTGFTSTFDATSITANRTYTMPDANTTLAGLSVNQTFSAQQIFGAGTYTTGNSFFGNNTAIINSVGQAGFGVNGSLSAQLTARGDGTNPIARFENSAGQNALTIAANGSSFSINSSSSIQFGGVLTDSTSFVPNGSYFRTNILSFNPDYPNYFNTFTNPSITLSKAPIGGVNTAGFLSLGGTIAVSSSLATANVRGINLAYTINNTAPTTLNTIGIYVNATETALNGMSHSLMDLQVGGVSRLKQASNGLFEQFGSQSDAAKFNGNGGTAIVYVGANIQLRSTGGAAVFQGNTNVPVNIQSQGTGSINLISATSLVRFGGTSSLFPALKCSGATLEARLADDSAYANFRAQDITGNRIVAGSTIFTASSSSANSAINIKSGTAPSAPTDGDIWNDGIDLYMHIAGATKRFSFVA